MSAAFDLQSLARAVALAGLALMATLPRLYFRRGGRMGLRWWLTATPFALQALWMLLAWRGSIASAEHPLFALGSLLATIGFLGLLRAAVQSHAQAPALWHQPAAATRLTTRGIYAHVRHPLYSAFLLLASAVMLAAPSVLALANLLLCSALLHWTTILEEAQLLSSPLAAQYQEYRRQAGRFVPRLRHD